MKEHATSTGWITDVFGSENPGECLINWNLALAGTYIFLLVLVYFIFYSGKYGGFRNFIKSWLLKLTILGGVAIYLIGYHVNEPDVNLGVKLLLALFSTARLFILGNDLIEVHKHINQIFLIWFSVFSVSAALISTSVLINFLAKSFKSWLRIIFNFSDKNYVFFGLNEAGLTLAKDIKAKYKSPFIVFIQDIFSTDDISLEHKISALDAILINSNTVSNFFNLQHEELIFQPNGGHEEHVSKGLELSLKKLSLFRKIKRRPTEFFILSENESANFHQANFLLNDLKKLKINKEFKIHIRTTSRNAEDIYKSLIDPVQKHIALHHQAQIAAIQLVNDNLPIKWIKEHYPSTIRKDATVAKNFTILFVGFGFTGNNVFRKFFEQGQFIGSKFKAIIIDQNLNVLKGEFLHKYPGVANTLGQNLEFHEVKIGSNEFYDILERNKSDIDYLVVSLGDDELNLKVAHDIKHFMNKCRTLYRIFIQISRNKFYLNNSDKIIKVFGQDNEVFTEEIIIGGSTGSIAENIHRYYNDRAPIHKRKDWEKLSNFTQSSNISLAEHAATKLILAGIDFQSEDESNSLPSTNIENKKDYTKRYGLINKLLAYNSYEELKEFVGDEAIENIAKTEHLRWNAFHFANGWNKWALEDIPQDQEKNKDEEKKIHACLVDWDELDKVSERFNNEDYKGYDRACLEDIYKNAQLGLYSKKEK